MYKWRPNHKCFYVISELHSNFYCLDIILKSILPLRIHSGQEDEILFMGDYVDGKWNTYETLDRLIAIKSEYPNRSHFLFGDREYMLLSGLSNQIEFEDWVKSGGASTITQYAEHANLKLNPFTIGYQEWRNIFPISHWNFLKSLKNSFEFEQFIFNHGALDEEKICDINSTSNVYRSLSKDKIISLNDKLKEKKYIFSHNPWITPKNLDNILLLGENNGSEIFVHELNSSSTMRIKTNKTKLYKYHIK